MGKCGVDINQMAAILTIRVLDGGEITLNLFGILTFNVLVNCTINFLKSIIYKGEKKKIMLPLNYSRRQANYYRLGALRGLQLYQNEVLISAGNRKCLETHHC